MLYTSPSLVLNTVKFGDSDMIVHCFTKEFGLKSYFLKSILSNKKSKFKKSFFLPFNQLEISANYNQKGFLNNIKEIDLMFHYESIHTNIFKQSIVLFLSEILSQTLKDEVKDIPLYDFLRYSVEYLDQSEDVSNFHLGFLGQYLKFLGIFPVIDSKVKYFDMIEGKFSNIIDHNLYLEEPEIQIFIKILSSDYKKLSEYKLSSEQRFSMLEHLLQYIGLHMSNFKKPNSMIVLHELFH